MFVLWGVKSAALIAKQVRGIFGEKSLS